MRKRLFSLFIAVLLIVAFAASPVHAAAKKKVRHEDPWKGRIGLGLRLGGGFGGGGSAFMAQAAVTYWWVKYFSTTAASGYGFYTANYLDANNDVKETTVNYVPSELLLTGHLFPDSNISPYLGPGLGVDYIWFDIENEKQSGVIYSGIARGGVVYRIAPTAGLIIGGRYTQPLNTVGDLEDDKTGYFSFEAGLALFL